MGSPSPSPSPVRQQPSANSELGEQEEGEVIYQVWAYVPESWLQSVGINYYPNKYWVLAFPVFLMVTVVLMLVFYLGLNFMATPPPTSFNTMFDEHSREPSSSIVSRRLDQPIEPISDIGIDNTNKAHVSSNLIFHSLFLLSLFLVVGLRVYGEENVGTDIDLGSAVLIGRITLLI
ncbi:hypothetical protein J5N97_029614 [Dioscorea zingiberensis]|uniref:PIG-P domain-containing protein n=1 Tax=Dioscorea zingiberensis TaxID=325984 RepID=A0A9D5H3G8_9LILI|nr:hypothetical protein J5N97_029614 [Dioscorea zingiberensis]